MLHHMRAVERRDRHEVEDDQHEVDGHPVDHHDLQDAHGLPGGRGDAADEAEERDTDREDHGEGQVARDPRQRHDDVAPAIVPVIARVHGHRLGAAEHDLPVGGEPHHEGHQDGEERVDVLDRVPGETTQVARGGVTLLERCVSVRVLVRDDGKQQNRCDEEDVLEGLVHRRK